MRTSLFLFCASLGILLFRTDDSFFAKAEQGCVEVETQDLKSMRVRSIRVEGNMALTAKEMHEIVSPYLNRELTAKEIRSLCFALQQEYVNKGYDSTCVFIKKQHVHSGELIIEITEARSWP